MHWTSVLFRIPASTTCKNTTFLSVNHAKLLLKAVIFHKRPGNAPIFSHLRLELLTQFPASNDEKKVYL